ncbi:aldo/keto reductase [Nocardioides sp. 616]|uniref:aldo/keto reductase n=1 Tax=Nocardioides sp. 616 TaxID=2268090 RepID=UPI001963F0EC|nr:aldo/keto reductase [Nocardioides sp. 616]
MDLPHLSLHDGTSIPQLGLGTYKVSDQDAQQVVTAALELGYRHIDTAQMYGNEAGVGRALRESGLPREELYVTTKLDNPNHEPSRARRSLEESLTKLGLDRVDLFLIHWPLPSRDDYVAAWRALVSFVEEGLVTSAGVSNFQPDHLDRVVAETGVVPVVNQVEVHPFFTNEAVRAANARHGVVTEAWSPIARGAVSRSEPIVEIADQLRRTPAQVTLRWHLQRGDVIFPKTTRPERMRENAEILDFELTSEQMATLSDLDRGPEGRTGPDPDHFG